MVEVYNPATDSWESKTDVPAGYLGHGAHAISDRIYVFSGSTTHAWHELFILSLYIPATDEWLEREKNPIGISWYASAAVGEMIYIVGGMGPGGGNPDPKIQVYDTATDTWYMMESDMPRPRAGVKAAVVDEKIYIFGGVEQTVPEWSVPYRGVDIYDPSLDGIIGTNEPDNLDIPSRFTLSQNYPNPFNPSTVLPFEMPRSGEVHLAVFDALGREVEVLVNGLLPAGPHEATFDARDLPSGMYLAQLRTPDGTLTRTIVLMR
jgi:hypothetical protein